MKAVIFAGGKKPAKALALRECQGAELIIGADKGAQWALTCNIIPHMVVGDMDSIAPWAFDKIKAMGIPLIRVPAQKDETDLQLALHKAWLQGADDMVILGGMGNRIDHVLGHIALLVDLHEKNVSACLKDTLTEIYITSGTFPLSAPIGTTISLIPLTYNVHIASLTDMAYPLHDVPLPYRATLGISNVVTGPHPLLVVKKGLVLVIKIKSKT